METTNYDTSLLLYDTPQHGGDQTNKQIITIAENDSTLDLSELLDPSFESAQNIQDLINKEGILFPDLLFESLQENHPQPTPTDSKSEEKPMTDEQSEGNELFHQINNTSHSHVVLVGQPFPEDLISHTFLEDGDTKEGVTAASDVTDFSHPPTSPCSSGSKSRSRRSRTCDKSSDEYKQRRQRNNIAVRKSRDKAKHKQKETEHKVATLVEENERLQKKVDLLSKELTVLKGLFTNVGADVPKKLDLLLK